MKLTPIRVRGKRGQPRKVTGKGKDKDKDTTTKSKKPSGESTATAPAPRKKTRLSQLPQEILERVFILSRNLSLPLASRALYLKLTSDSIKYQLVGAAFGPTWRAWCGIDRDQVRSYRHYHGCWREEEYIDGDPLFQSAVLARSWAQLPLMLEAYEVWTRQHGQDSSSRSRPLAASDPPEEAPDRSSRAGLSPKEIFAQDLANYKRAASGLFKSTPLRALPLRSVSRSAIITRPNCALAGSPALEVHPRTSIPDSLLSGPFDAPSSEERLHRLFWLVRGGARLQRTQTWELTRQGFRSMVALKDTQLVRELVFLFMVLGVFQKQWPSYIVHKEIENIVDEGSRSTDSERRAFYRMLVSDIIAGVREKADPMYLDH